VYKNANPTIHRKSSWPKGAICFAILGLVDNKLLSLAGKRLEILSY
jgi:hypothetical protein